MTRRIWPLLIAGSIAGANMVQSAAAETWFIVKADGTCIDANDVADLTGKPEFSSPFKMGHLGAHLQVDRDRASGQILSVIVSLPDNSRILYFPDMTSCVAAAKSIHHG